MHAFYLATLAGAKALRIDDKVGNLLPGKEADFLVVDLAATPLLARRTAGAATIAEKLFVLSILGDDRNAEQIVPEEVALARLQTGEVDAIWAYSTESTSRGLDFIDLPPQINLGDPKESAGYAAASVVVGMKTFRGAPIVYAVTVPTKASNPSGGAAFVAFLLGAEGKALLARAGLSILRASTVGDRSAIPPVLIPILR